MLEPSGILAVLSGLSGEVALLSGDVEIKTAQRRPVDLIGDVQQRFGPARAGGWVVTGVAVFSSSGRRVATVPFEDAVRVGAGQMFRLSLAASVE